MNNRFNFVMTALMSSMLLLSACSQPSSQAGAEKTKKSATTQETQQPASAPAENAQTFTVGVDAAYPPYDFRDEHGEAVGFDVDLIKAVAEKQGFGLNVVAKEWDNLVADFDKGVYDISLVGYYPSDERKQKYLVSRPYAYGQDVVVSKKGGAVTQAIKTADQLKNLKVAVQGNSPYEEQLKSYGVTSLSAKSTSFLAFQAVARGEADAMVLDHGVGQYYIQQLAGKTDATFDFHELSGEDFEHYELVILVPKGKEELMEKINQGIVDVIKDGTYATIYKKWFGVEPDANHIPKV